MHFSKSFIKNFIVSLFFCNTTLAVECFTPQFKEENITNVAKKLVDNTSLSLWLAGTVSSLHFQQYDTEARNNWKDHQQISVSTSDAGNILGSGFATLGIIAGQYYWDTDPQNWKSHTRALAWEAVSVTVLKYSFGKQRPGDKNSYLSFPSGHTATAFATATSLTYSYGWKAALISYPLAALVGASRMADDMHWISDVVGGAFLGIIIGRATFSENTATNTNSLLMPIVNQGDLGLAFYHRF